MVQIVWTHLAKDELKQIYKYISKDSKLYAKRQVSKIKDRTLILKTRGVEIGKIVPEFKDPNVREVLEGNYRIIYKVYTEKKIVILTIHHSSRDINRRGFLK